MKAILNSRRTPAGIGFHVSICAETEEEVASLERVNEQLRHHVSGVGFTKYRDGYAVLEMPAELGSSSFSINRQVSEMLLQLS